MDIQNYNNSIIICHDEAKRSIVKLINDAHMLLNIKVISLSELKKKWCFDYTKKTIYNVCKKYNIIYEIAKMYVDNLYYVSYIDDDKVKFLSDIKEYLDENNLLIYNPLFKSFLSNKKVYLYDLEDIDKFYMNIFNELRKVSKVISINNDTFNGKKKLYRAKFKSEEVEFVASEIVSLIKSGVDINHIKLVNVNDDYIYTIKKVFSEFNIPIELEGSCAGGSIIISKFIENYNSDIKVTLSSLDEYIKSSEDNKLYKKIIDVIDEYVWCDDYNLVKDMVISDINGIKLNSKKYKNSVRVCDIHEIFSDKDYVFMLNFNEGVIPKTIRNEDYLDDSIKDKLNISSSIDLNVKNKAYIAKRIGNIKNLVVTLSKSDLNGELYISNAYSDELFTEEKIRISHNNSNLYNQLELVSALDEFNKYKTINKALINLRNHYSDMPYNTYDNKFSGLDKSKVYDYLDNKLTLSYSSLNTYYLCAFRYYLDNVLKLNMFDNTFETSLGRIFHEVLSKYKSGENLDKLYSDAINNISDYEFNERDKFFLEKLRCELDFILSIIDRQNRHSKLNKEEYEKRINVPVDKSRNIYFKGFIDKIKYDEIDNERVVSIVDYKTGEADINLKNVKFGLSMQLPSYIYLLKNSEYFKNARIGGFYLEHILSNKTNLEDKIKESKLYGYTNSDTYITKLVDDTYIDSEIISGLKVSSNGFYAYSKVIDDDSINKLYELTKKNIENAGDKIYNAEFNINPKELNNELIGCKFCKYKSICFMKNEDKVKLESGEVLDDNMD